MPVSDPPKLPLHADNATRELIAGELTSHLHLLLVELVDQEQVSGTRPVDPHSVTIKILQHHV